MGASESKERKPSSKQCIAKCKNCKSATRPVTYQCTICSIVICEHCNDSLKDNCITNRDHLLVNIKDIGKNIIQISKQFPTDVDEIHCLCTFEDGSLWISSFGNKTLQCYKQHGDNLQTVVHKNMEVLGIAVSSTNTILLCVPGESHLKKLSLHEKRAYVCDTVYDASPLSPSAIHVTGHGKVIIGAHGKGRALVSYWNEEGRCTHHHDLFTSNKHSVSTIVAITSTKNKYIHVVEFTRYDTELEDQARVVVLNKKAKIKNIYTGHSDINKYKPFHPKDIATTPKDNVIVLDTNTQHIHALLDTGLVLAIYDLRQVGLLSPLSIAFDPTGLLWLACKKTDGGNQKAELLLLNLI